LFALFARSSVSSGKQRERDVTNKKSTLSLIFTFVFSILINTSNALSITFEDYEKVLEGSQKIEIEGESPGDGKELEAYLYKPKGKGPFPALIALHGAGGIFPYQLWWAKEISKKGYVVLFIDHYCTRHHLCEVESDDEDQARGEIMRNWQEVSPRQRVFDAVAGYNWLTSESYIKNKKIGLIGWSWGGSSALFAQKIARRLSLPNGGFKATIAFYPNLKYVLDKPQWSRTGPIEQPTLILYGKADILESAQAYETLLSAGYSGDIRVVGFDEAFRKFDELGPYREKHHPAVGDFGKAFQKKAFDMSRREIEKFLSQHFQ